jgi:N6-L-threonylcarbamoyladenine synthase
VHHIAAHIAANYLTYPELEPPFTCLIVSGGHSQSSPSNWTKHTACSLHAGRRGGEAFDKVARALGLAYPGGPNLEKLALEGNPNAFTFHSAFNEAKGTTSAFPA